MSPKIVLIGAGSVQFGLGTLGDIFQCQPLTGSHVVLHDINADALAVVENEDRGYIAEHNLSFELTATTDRKQAVTGADFCIISIEIGDRFELWEQDWYVPLQYGIRQVYGENGGPGGLFHSLRIIPPILEICADIQSLAPEAYVFNFSNPMSRICTTVTRKFPDLRFIGLCHEIKSLSQHLPPMLGTPISNLSFRAGGLNHFSILLETSYRDSGRDAYPDVREKAVAYFENLSQHKRVESGAGAKRTITRKWAERGLFRYILEVFGYLPITTDSHFGEYIPWAHDVVDHKGILDFYNWYKAYCRAKKTLHIQTDYYEERIVPIIEAILSDAGMDEAAVNVPNQGRLIEQLPEDVVVEVPAVIDAKGIHGSALEAFPKAFAGLLLNQAAVHDLTAEAVINRSRQMALQALLVDPVVHSARAAEQTLSSILELQKAHLGYLV